jgi:putative DNA primase/helicase
MTLIDDPQFPAAREARGADQPVSINEILDDLVSTLRRYLVLPFAAAEAIALWTIHAHAHDAARISPLLALLSPDRRCGKTTALELIGSLVPRPLTTANISSAALFRVVEKMKPTILIDEADTFVRRDESLRGILNAGHVRTSAFIIRATADAGIHPFSVWCPKVLAAIGSLPATLSDRAITIRLSRKRSDEIVERLRLDQGEDRAAMAGRIGRWVVDNLDHLRSADPYVPQVLNDRVADNWRALLAIAEMAGGEWAQRAQNAAIALSSSMDDSDETDATLLLADIQQIFDQWGRDRLRSTDLTAALALMEHRRWPEWRNGKPMTAVQLAGQLARFDIRPTTHRFGETTDKGYLFSQFTDSFARYVKLER